MQKQLRLNQAVNRLSSTIDKAQPGDIIQIRGGTYYLSKTIRIKKNGKQNKRFTLISYPGEWATIDGSRFSTFDSDRQDNAILRRQGASHWNFKNFSIRKSPSYGNAILNSSNNITLENLRAFDKAIRACKFQVTLLIFWF